MGLGSMFLKQLCIRTLKENCVTFKEIVVWYFKSFCLCIMNGTKLDIKKNVFTMRVVKRWKRLPTGAVDAPGLSVFKRQLDNALINVL